MTSVDPLILKSLRCPASHSELLPISETELADLNRLIADGSIKRHGGQHVTQPLTAALKNADATLAYPIRSDIIQLIADDAIALPSSFHQQP